MNMHLPKKWKTFLIGLFQGSGIMHVFKKCVAIFKLQLKFLFHHNKWLSLIELILKYIKNLQFSMFLMIPHVMRILQAIYQMAIWNIGGRTHILQPLKKLLILNFEIMNILIIINVLFK